MFVSAPDYFRDRTEQHDFTTLVLGLSLSYGERSTATATYLDAVSKPLRIDNLIATRSESNNAFFDWPLQNIARQA